MAYKRTVEVPTIWDGLRQQSPLASETDYFDDSSLDTGLWEEFDPGSAVTVAEDSNGLVITSPSDASKKYGGIIQDTPSYTRYTITAQISTNYLQAAGGDGLSAGVIWGEDLAASGGAPTTGNFYLHATTLGTTGSISHSAFQQYSSYTTWAANYAISPYPGHVVPGPIFLRLYVDTSATTIEALSSIDGKTWVNRGAKQTYSLTPGSMGLVIHNQTTSSVDAKLISTCFRIDDTADPFLACGGLLQVTI